MTATELRVKNRELFSEFEVFDPEIVNKVLKEALGKLMGIVKNANDEKDILQEKGWADSYFGMWSDMSDETVNEILSSRTSKAPIDL